MEVTVTRETTASPAAVWAVMTDIEGTTETLSGVTGIERLDGGEGFGPGLRWRETREVFGEEATEELEVTAVDPGRSYTVEADSGGTHYRSVLTVEPAATGATGATITMTFGAEQSGGRIATFLSATVGRLFQGPTRKALQQDLDDIAAAAEAAEDEAAGDDT